MIDLNLCVAFITRKLYNKNIAIATPNVKPTACITRPGYFSLNASFNTAEIAPNAKPSSMPYAGDKYGAKVGLKLIAITDIKPPIKPTHIKVIMVCGWL